MNPDVLVGVGVVFVEYHSNGLVAARAADMIGLGCEVVVADNSGTYTGAGKIVHTGGNIGFGAGCNAGVAALSPAVDVVILHNPDALVGEVGLLGLVEAVRSGWAAVGPTLLTDRLRPYGFAVPGLAREVALSARETYRVLRPTRRKANDAVPGTTTPFERGVVRRPGRFASAAMLALDRAAFEQVDGFDEDYFLYVEDLDLWYRMEMAGYRLGFVPSVVARHTGASGSSAGASRRVVLRWLGRELFARRAAKGSTWIRAIHRVSALLLPQDDEIVRAVRSGFAQGRSAVELNREVRHLLSAPSA